MFSGVHQSSSQDALPRLDFIRAGMSLEQQVDEWNKQYVLLWRRLLAEREEWQMDKNSGLALIGDYRRDNQQLETEKRQWEQERRFQAKLVMNLRSRVEHYQRKLGQIKQVYDIDVDEMDDPAGDGTEAMDETPDGSRLADTQAARREFPNGPQPSKAQLAQEAVPQARSAATHLAVPGGGGDEDLDDPNLDDRARMILMRQRRESEYLRKECEALEDELKQLQREMGSKEEANGSSQGKGQGGKVSASGLGGGGGGSGVGGVGGSGGLDPVAEEPLPIVTNEELVERLNEAWAQEVAIVLESMTQIQRSGARGDISEATLTAVKQELTTHMELVSKQQLSEMQKAGATEHGVERLPHSRLMMSGLRNDSDDEAKDDSPALLGAHETPNPDLFQARIRSLEEYVERIEQSKVALVESVGRELDHMRGLLKSYNPDFKYRRILDRLLRADDDDRFKKLFDQIDEYEDESDLDDFLDAIQHLKDVPRQET